MKYERINKKYTKTIIISFIVIIIIGSVLVLNITKAKYKTTISVQIVNGTIKYYGGNADLNVMAVYQQKEDSDCTEDGCYNLVDDIPNAGYKIDIDKSYCTEPNNQKKQSNVISFKGDVLSVKMARKGTKCYLYFNKQKTSNNILTDLGLKSNGQATDFNKTSCNSGCDIQENGVYEAEDDFGTSYYFRGTVNNNWVKFGKDSSQNDIWWRIIRINGDGTIRLIYAGTSSNDSEPYETQISGTFAFNSQINNNMYVGYEYKSDDMHGFGQGSTPSDALTQLNVWFTTNLADEFNYGYGQIDPNAGFCNDRSGSTNQSENWIENTMEDSGGTEKTVTFYGAYLRLHSHKQPTLKCSTINNKNKDYFTSRIAIGIKENSTDTLITGTQSLQYPVGLITADEGIFAGGVFEKGNSNYWLYTGKNYWMMTPYYYTSVGAEVFAVNIYGTIDDFSAEYNYGLRPVINLKSDTKFTFKNLEGNDKGTSKNPYIVIE